MRVDRVVLFIFVSFVVSMLSGCGPASVKKEPLVPIGAEQIEQISDYAELLALYQQSQKALVGKDATEHADDFVVLSSMADRLVSLKQSFLSVLFKKNRVDSGEIPLSVLKALKEEASPVPADKWAPIASLIQAEWEITNKALKDRVNQLETEKLDDGNRLVIMDDLYRLSADTQWLDRRNEVVDRIIEEIRQAKREGTLSSELQSKINLVRENRTDNKALMEELVAVSAEIYQQDYFKALSEGEADKAYEIFVAMSNSKDFNEIKKKLADSSQKMVDYLIAEADESVKDPANLPQSYRWYSQAKMVSQKLGFKSSAITGHKTLVDQLHNKYKEYYDAGEVTLALAYLYFIQEFSPLHKGLRQRLAETREKVRTLAIKRLSTTQFEGGASAGYGDVVSSKITQYLFKHVPNDVRIIERKEYEAIQRERNLGGSASGLSAVNLLVSGSVLEAKVDATEQKGKKTIRAKVGKEMMPNQAYIKWLELSAKDREKIDKPDDTIHVDREENISINVTNHRKVGIFSVSYRLVDAENGRVLFPDSITKEQEYTDTSREGVEMGDFVLPFELADLPSDVKILDKLANEVSEAIGASLVKRLKDQELRYLSEADEFSKDGSCVEEADSLAKALVIMEAKDLDKKEVFSRYKNVTIHCGAKI